jgi:hypothetical protein
LLDRPLLGELHPRVILQLMMGIAQASNQEPYVALLF